MNLKVQMRPLSEKRLYASGFNALLCCFHALKAIFTIEIGNKQMGMIAEPRRAFEYALTV